MANTHGCQETSQNTENWNVGHNLQVKIKEIVYKKDQTLFYYSFRDENIRNEKVYPSHF